MKTISVSPGSVLATESTLLDMVVVRRYYELFRKRRRVKPIVLLLEPENGRYYLADGNHKAYAALLAHKRILEGPLLETDDDVRTYDLGATKKFRDLAELLEYCRRQNMASSKELGVTYIQDYGSIDYAP